MIYFYRFQISVDWSVLTITNNKFDLNQILKLSTCNVLALAAVQGRELPSIFLRTQT